MEDSTQFCENCERDISEKNFELHITHCRRNIKLCDLCNEPISISMFKAHLDEDHAVVSCSNCEIPLEKWMLPQHQNSCERRHVICEFCEAEVIFNEYNEHKDFCGSRTEKCVLCQKYIMLKDEKSHSLVHLPPKQICKENVDISQDVKQNSDIRYDSKVKPYVPNKYNQKSYISQNMYDEAMQHSETIETSSEKSEKSEAFLKRYGVCHICKNFVAWVDMNIHIPTCASDAGKCSLCGEDVLDEGIKEHMEKYCSKQSKTVSSRRHNSDDKITRNENRHSSCNKGIYEETSDARHSNSDAASLQSKSKSYNNDIYEETSDARHSVSDSAIQPSKPKHSENRENIESRCTVASAVSLSAKPETYCVCPLCNMPVPRAKIKIHINICDADTQKCIHCDEDVPNNDVEKHNCCTDKKNYDSAAARSYHDIPIEKASEAFIKSCPYCYQQCSADHYLDDTMNCPQNLFECTLCGDKIPQKDKGMHEGFYCKALLDNYPPSNSCVPTYAESVQNITESRDLGPTSWDEDAICPTCHCRISISDLDEHSVLCKSPIKSCKFCTQDVQAEYEEYHLKVCPVIQDLQNPISRNPKDHSLCKKDVPKNDHPSKMKICSYCKIMYQSDILLYHKEECQTRVIKCNCGKQMKLKNYEKHKCGKNYSIAERSSENKESYERRKPSAMQVIKNFLGMDDTRSNNYYGGYSQAPYTFTNHETSIPTAPEYSESELIPCEFCNKKFPFENIIEHTTGCDPELVSRLKKNPLNCERESNSLAYQHSFFENGKASSQAITKQSKKKNQEPRTEPGQFLHHSSKDSMLEEKYHLQSNMKSFWGEKCDTENESSELSSDDRKPEYAKAQKNEMSKLVPKEFSSDSDEEIHPYEASINKKNLIHSKKKANKYKQPENGSKSLNEYQSPSQKTSGSDMGLNSECLAQGKRPKNFKKLKAEETVFKSSKASESFSGEDDDDNRRDYRSVQSSSENKHSRRVCQKSEEEMEWSEYSSLGISELKNDFAEEETHDETVPVKGPIRNIEDRQKQTDVEHDRKSLKERVHEKELSGIRKVLSEIKLGNNEIMPITHGQASKKRNMSGNRLKFSDASEKDKFDYEHYENKSYLDGEGHAELQKNSFEGSEAEYVLHKMNYSNCSEDDFVEINESNHSKFGIIGQDRNIHGDMHSEASLIQREGESPLSVKPDKFISGEIFENKNPDIMINKQSKATKTDNNKSSPSHSAEYYQKLQNFSFRACDYKKLDSTKDAINYEENSTEASAKDYVNIYSQVNNLSVEYITVQYGQKDKMKGYVSSLTLGDEKYLSYPELKPTKELAEESAARKAVVSIKKKIEDMSRSKKELESRVPDTLQQKQHMESHSKEFEQFSNFRSQAYQMNQKPKTYPESEEHKKDKDITHSNIPKSRKIIESGESDIQQQKPSMGAEIGTNRPLLLTSDYFQMQQDYTSRTQDNRHKDSKNIMNEDYVFTDDGNQGMLRSSKVQENRDEEILSRKHAFKMEMHVDKPFSTSSEYYKKHQHLSSTLSTDKRLDSNKNKVSVNDSGDEEKFSFKTEHGKLRFYKTSENNEPNMDLQSSLLLKQNMKSAIDMSSLNKNCGDDYQKHQSGKITQNEELEDKKNKIDSREFLAQGRNRGYENPAFSVEPVTKTPEQSKAKDKSYNEIIDGMKESLENAKLALGRSDGRRRDIDAMVVEHDKRIEAWRKWRHSKSQDSEEEL